MPPLLSDAARRKRIAVLAASLLFMLVGTGSVYFIVVALKQVGLTREAHALTVESLLKRGF